MCSTIYNIRLKLKKTGSAKKSPRKRKAKKLSGSTARAMYRSARRDPTLTSAELKRLYEVSVSPRTIRRSLVSQGLISVFETPKAFLSKKSKGCRLEWAKAHSDWTVEDWRKVFFTDESPFGLRFKGRQRVWRKRGEKYDPRFVKGRVKHQQKIMVWGGFSYNGVGGFYKIDSKMEKFQYLKIVEYVGMPSALELLGPGFIWQQDNDPKHTSLLLKEYFGIAAEIGRCTLLPWPSYSPDLNPIENLWFLVDRMAKARSCNTALDLFEALEAAWKAVPLDYLQKLIDSMPRRVQAVIKAKGSYTKY